MLHLFHKCNYDNVAKQEIGEFCAHRGIFCLLAITEWVILNHQPSNPFQTITPFKLYAISITQIPRLGQFANSSLGQESILLSGRNDLPLCVIPA